MMCPSIQAVGARAVRSLPAIFAGMSAEEVEPVEAVEAEEAVEAVEAVGAAEAVGLAERRGAAESPSHRGRRGTASSAQKLQTDT